jgi:tetratricopeptide (TPR) repeat protein
MRRPIRHLASVTLAAVALLATAAAGAATSPDQEFDSGLFHYARGEYRQAADAFDRSGARLEPGRKPLARYWCGLSWLGGGDLVRARSAFEDVAAVDSPWRSLAQLGLANAWEAARRPDRAMQTLASLMRDDPGEAGATALARWSALAAADGQVDVARRAHDRLLREFPASIEAASARLAELPRIETLPRLAVQLGAFAEPTRAAALAETARRAGLGEVRVHERSEGGMTLHLVLLGPFVQEAEARRVAARAGERLGVVARVVSAP